MKRTLAAFALPALGMSAPSSVRIESMEIVRVPVNRRGGWVLVRVRTDQGVTGVGDASHGRDEVVIANLRTLFAQIKGKPFTAIEELRWARRIIEETKQELKRENQAIDTKIEIGIMIEVPSAALRAADLAKEADFFSIGTNDLTQYTLAVDRGNELVANLYSAANPAVIDLIRMTIEAANAAKISVSMCGEMAGDPIFTSLLLGMGLTEISISPPSIPEIKKIIRTVSYEKCKTIAAHVRTLTDTSAILEYLRGRLGEDLPGGEKFGAV